MRIVLLVQGIISPVITAAASDPGTSGEAMRTNAPDHLSGIERFHPVPHRRYPAMGPDRPFALPGHALSGRRVRLDPQIAPGFAPRRAQTDRSASG